ncbi:MAG TPA: 4Fe-4S binding protein [Casimicrobiaceae bacterium]|nr:4Fe-4S binding protein [Casimicrobiaceae bacterium]
MTIEASVHAFPALAPSRRGRLFAVGEWMRTHQRALRVVQWIVVAVYAFMIVVPAFLPLPPEDAHWFNNLTVLAQWVFWGFWWPGVIASMFLLGRTWCGVFCPEGTLTEATSRIGLGRGVPRWMRWGGWPFVAFALTTIFGQLVSVYQYAAATLLVLGGSTLAAVAVGFVYGRGKRVWCRHLCPVNGVFAVLSRVAPVHYRVDSDAWKDNATHIRVHPVNCAPMVRIRRMTGPSECHMCARCSGLRGSVELAARAPNDEIVRMTPESARGWDAVLIVFGMIGIAIGAFEWSASSAFVTLRTSVADWVIDHGPAWLLRDDAPWWLLTNYPEAKDVFTWLDGALIVAWITVTASIVGVWVVAWLMVAGRALSPRVLPRAIALSYALVPLAGAGLLVGLSGLTATLAHAEGFHLAWLAPTRVLLLVAAAAWSAWLAYGQVRSGTTHARSWVALSAFGMGVVGILAAWMPFVFRVI